LGIGTASPAGILDVAGDGPYYFGNTSDDTTKSSPIVFRQHNSGTESEGFMGMMGYSNSTDVNDIYIGGGLGDYNGATNIYLRTQSDTTTRNATTRMSILSSGNVGIGTASPSQLLHIKGAVPTLLFEDSTNGNLAFIGDAADFLTSGDTDADAFGIRSEGEIRLGTGGNNTRMLINSSGNVGVGTTSPGSLLTVKGDNKGIDVRSNDYSNVLIASEGSSGAGLDRGLIVLREDGSNKTLLYGSGAADFGGKVEIAGSYSGYILQIHNDGNHDAYRGIDIKVGQDGPTGTNYVMRIADGDDSEQGLITFSGGTVTYGAFTANHEVELSESDNENGYPYGTLVEHTELFYKQKNGSDTERGILYKAQKSSSAYSKSVLGAYSSKHATDVHENLHQVYVLGDGHILCNGEKGNIEIGDGICSSSTDGEGMKADKMAMIIGIAQEDVSFSGSESKLVAVQYGLQQFTPWENA